MTTLQIKIAVYGTIALVIGVLLWRGYDAIYDRGFEAAKAECVAAAEKQAANNESAAASASSALQSDLGKKLPQLETNAYESAERIRTVYVDRPVPGECAWAGRVLGELEAGRQAANRAVRSGAGSAGPADPAPP